jgi:carboxyvinyl-carboxyphosphonate phosphorylmutase
VTELETAGVCAITIEDTLLPAPYGDATGKGLISIDEGVGKMRAALAARRDPSLIIVGRTSALGVSTIEDTIARVSAYEKTGVDAIFLAGATTREQIDALSKDRKLPLFLGGVPAPMLDQDYLTSRGVKLCLLGHNAYMASVNAIHATMKAIREGTKPQDLKGLASGDLIKRATRREDYERWAKDYLGA